MAKDTPSRENLSFMGRNWLTKPADPAALSRLRKLGAGGIAAHVLASRGIDEASYSSFITPKIKELIPHPHSFLGMKEAAGRLVAALKSGEKIGIWSDYDVDGATSAAILGSFLRMCGNRNFDLRIPDRIHEGYGPNAKGLLEMQEAGCSLICILDAGTTAFEPLAAAHEAGLDVVVIDHHAAEPELPLAVAVVNPNRQDQPEGQGHICAAGMTFIFAVATTMALRAEGWFDGKEGRPGAVPDVWSLLDLVALGTVCDVVPLIGVNRAFVYRGLPLLSKRTRPGIAHLAAVSGIAPGAEITEKECGWVFGPRINAGGRIGASDSGALLLLEEDGAIALERAEALHTLNAERKDLDGSATEAAIAQFADRVPGIDRTIAIAVVEDAHEGVVGISAARLREACDAPAIVLSKAHDGSLKGSARSVPGFDIGAAIIAARQAEIILKGGGHGMAGGLTVAPERLAEFERFMNSEIERSDYARDGVSSDADVVLNLSGVSVEGIRELDLLRPFGTANPEPRVILQSVGLEGIHVMKARHLKLELKDGSRRIDGLIWGVVSTPMEAKIRGALGQKVDVYGALGVNTFRGNSTPQIILSDLRLSPEFLL